MSTKSILIAGVVVVALSAGWAYERYGRNDEAAESNRKIAALAASVEELASRPAGTVKVVEKRTVTVASPMMSALPAEEKASDDGPKADDSTPGAESEALLKRRSELATQCEDDHRDTDWTPTAEAALSNEVAALQSETTKVSSISCKSSICRIDAEFASQEDYNTFWKSLFLGNENLRDLYARWEVPHVTEFPDGSFHARGYMTRP